jgi:hypothetical protein
MIRLYSSFKAEHILIVFGFCLIAVTGVLIGSNSAMILPLIAIFLLFLSVFLIYTRPAYGVAAILFLAPLQGVVVLPGLGTLIRIVATIVSAIFMLLLLTKRLQIQFDRGFILILLFLGWSLTSILWSSRFSFSSWLSLLLAALLYLLLINLILSRRDLLIAVWGHIIGSAVLAVIMIQQISPYLTRTDVAALLGETEQGLNLSARLVGLGLMLVLFIYLSGTHNKVNAVLVVGAISLLGFPILTALSRGTWYAIVLGLTTYSIITILYFKTSYRSLLGLLFSLAMGLTLFWGLSTANLNPRAVERISQRAQSAGTIEGAEDRLRIVRATQPLVSDSLLLGHGYGEARYLLGTYLSTRSGIRGSHNAFVKVFLETGLVGLAIFLILWISIGYNLIVGIHQAEYKREVVAFAAAIFTYLLVASVVDDSVNRHYLWYGFALVILIIRFAGTSERSARSMKRS